MDSLDQQVLAAARQWAAEGQNFALVTVAATWGSSPRPPGAWLVVRADGLVQGSVSGGCIEDDLIERMRAGRLSGDTPFPLHYGLTKEEATRWGLPCGGRLELVVEPQPSPLLLADMEERILAGELLQKEVDLAHGVVRLLPGNTHSTVQWDGVRLVTPHGPRLRLLIIGAGQISKYLASMAQSLDYQVSVCDPRIEYSSAWNVAGATWLPGMPDDVVQAMGPDPNTAIVALTHDPKLDDMALLEALKSSAFYVGALGSKLNNARRRERLVTHFDITRDEAEKLHGPVGLAIGSKTPPEIAISILAEMIAVRRRSSSS